MVKDLISIRRSTSKMTSLKASEKGLEIINAARLRKGWSKSSDIWADLAKVSSGTLKRFWQGKAIRCDSFQEICSAVGLYNWREIANFNSPASESFKSSISAQFITGNPILNPKFFFGRELSLKRIFNTLKRHPLQNIAIIGKRRSGKTSLLHYLSTITNTLPERLRENQKNDWLATPEKYSWIFIDFQDKRMTNQGKLLGYILNQIGIQHENQPDLESFMELVSSNIKKPTIILLDEIDVALQSHSLLDDPFWDSLRSLSTNYTQGNLAFILASSRSPIELAQNTGYTSPFFNIFGRVIKLGALAKTEAYELIDSSPLPFPEEDREWIIRHSHCWPLLLQILCSECLFSLEEAWGEKSSECYDWKSQALMATENFWYLLDPDSE